MSEYELKVGTIIPAILTTAINSDLPGMIIAQVSRPVRDSKSGAEVLIPAGSKLIGDYDSHIAFGQRRVLVIWRRVQFPDASTLELPALPGIDAAGQAGLQDKTNNHYLRTFGGATMLSVIAGYAQSLNQNDDESRYVSRGEAISDEAGRQWSEVGKEQVKRSFDVQPTLVIRPGYRFNVLINQDIILDPVVTDRSSL